MSSLADKPVQYFIVPETAFAGEQSILRVTNEAGPYVGSVVPFDSNRGELIPLASGSPTNALGPVTLRIVDPGSSDDAGFAWRRDDDATANPWVGVDDPRYWWGHHSTHQNTIGSDNCAIVYSSKFRRLLVFNIDTTATDHTMAINYRDVDDDAYDQWTSATDLTLTRTVESSANQNNLRVVELDDGTLLAVVRVDRRGEQFTNEPDFDAYHSDDGGLTWDLVSSDLWERAFPPGEEAWQYRMQVVDQFSLAVSGDWLRIDARVVGGIGNAVAGAIYSIVSTDRGITWKLVEDSSPIVPTTNADSTNPSPFYSVGIGNGRFFLAYPSTASQVFFSTAERDADWGGLALSSWTVGEWKSIICSVGFGYLWVWVQTNDGLGDIRWQMRRDSLDSNFSFTSDPSWETIDDTEIWDSSENNSGRADCVFTGNMFAFVSSARSYAGAEVNFPKVWYGLGWTDRSLGWVRLSDDINKAAGVGASAAYIPLFTLGWNTHQGEPSAGPGSNWTKNTNGSFSVGSTMGRLQLTGNATLARVSYQINVSSATQAWFGVASSGRSEGSAFEWVMNVDENDNSIRTDDIGVRLVLGGPTSNCKVELRIGSTGVTVRDVVGASNADTILADIDNGNYWEFRFWKGTGAGAQAQLSLRDMGGSAGPAGEWIDGTIVTLSIDPSAANNEAEFGHYTNQSQPSQMVSRWRSFRINGQEMLTMGGIEDNTPGPSGFPGFSNPENLFGAVCNGSVLALKYGMNVQLAGSAGALADRFTLNTAHTYPASNVLIDSPRIEHRSDGEATQLVSFRNTYDNAVWTKGPDGDLVTVNPDSIDDPFGVALNADRVALTASAAGSRALLLQTITEIAADRGYTISFWARQVSGVPIGIAPVLRTGAAVGSGPSAELSGFTLTTSWQRFEYSYQTPGGQDFVLFLTGLGNGDAVSVGLYDVRVHAQHEIVLRLDENDSGGDWKTQFNAIGLYRANVRRIAVDLDSDTAFGSPTSENIVDFARYQTGANPVALTAVNGKSIEIDTATHDSNYAFEGFELNSTNEVRVRGVTGEAAQEITRVRRHRRRERLFVDDVPTTAADFGFAAADTVALIGDSANASFGLVTQSYLRLRFVDENTAEGYYRLGTVVAGVRQTINVPLDWAWTDNKQGNNTRFRTKSAVQWAYKEGPPQRTFIARMVGDVERYRDRLRGMLDLIDYEVGLLVMVLDEDRPNDMGVLGRLKSGSQLDNSAWWRRVANDQLIWTAGDQSLTFEEEV